jgi:alkylation response protein AidB-like acyl-CoA dehydrogenase
VDHDLNDDQRLFVQATERFLESTYPLAAVRVAIASGNFPRDEYRLQVAELGWFSMLVPDDLGGGTLSGNGVFDCSLVARAMGATLQPITLIETNVVAYALSSQGSTFHQSTVLPRLIDGQESATWAIMTSRRDSPLCGGVVALPTDSGYLLNGSSTLVLDADNCDWILVTASSEEGPSQFLLPADTSGMTIQVLEGLDITRRFCQVDFDDAVAPESSLVGPAGGAANLIDRQIQIASTLGAAEAIGAMEYDFNLTLQYAKDRVAFGRPIGSFQAIKHSLADMSLKLEMSKGIVAAATKAVGTGTTDAAHVASMAKAFVSDTAMTLGPDCFQIFGGIGYTWEHDQHLYLRRMTMDAVLYGDAAWHRERLCLLAEL